MEEEKESKEIDFGIDLNAMGDTMKLLGQLSQFLDNIVKLEQMVEGKKVKVTIELSDEKVEDIKNEN